MGNVRPGGRAAKDRRATADERQKARNERGDLAQLVKLEKQGHTHCKEAKRLRARLLKQGVAPAEGAAGVIQAAVGESSSPLTMSKFASKAELRRAQAQRAGK